MRSAVLACAIVAAGATLGGAALADDSRGSTPSTFVELEASDGRATLSRRVGTGFVASESPFLGMRHVQYGGVWEDVCLAPCTRAVSSDAVYRIEGEGLWPSGSFRLPAGSVGLRARMGSRGGLLGGVLLTVTGGGLTLMGGMLLAFSALPIDSTGPHGQPRGSAPNLLLPTALVVLGLGAIGLTTGIVLWSGNTSTVTDEHGQVVGRIAPPARAWALTPTGLAF